MQRATLKETKGVGGLNTEATVRDIPHLVVVDTYSGWREHLYDEGDREREWLGLPLAELVRQNKIHLTVLHWDDWLAYEQQIGSFMDWMPFPATRPAEPLRPPATRAKRTISGITVQPVPALDPAFAYPFSMGLSPLTYGLLADSDPLFLMSYVLKGHLEALHRLDPIAAILLPMFGGLGYVSQLSRATSAGLVGIPFGVVVTDTSYRRQVANEEGLWTRPAITRRQMEDLSLALADITIGFGPRAEQTARTGTDGAVFLKVPREIKDGLAEEIIKIAAPQDSLMRLNFFIEAPLQGSAGTLAMLDAACILRDRNLGLDAPIACSGMNMVFAPHKPKDFKAYWSGRGWVRNIVESGYWCWTNAPRATHGAVNVRVYPTRFDHLPAIAEELARGSLVLLSDAAAEGLPPLPAVVRLGESPTPDAIADRITTLQGMGAREADRIRQDLCHIVGAHLASRTRTDEVDRFCSGIHQLMTGRCVAPRLGQAARLLLDRKNCLSAIPKRTPSSSLTAHPTLAVAVACYEMGDLVIETIESVWLSTRIPDELILVDDGSAGEATRSAIARLERSAATRSLPLTVICQANSGLAGARNAALAAAHSSHISFLDGDDLIAPDFYALAMNVFTDNPELGGVAAWAEVFGEGTPDAFWNAPQAELPLLLVENTIIVPCVMPVQLLRSLGGYDAGQRYNYEDWELAVRLLAAGWPIVTIPRYLQRYRVRADSLLRTMSDVQNQVMRERFFASHRQVCSQFATEVALQIEHRLFLCSAAAAASKYLPSRWQLNVRKVYTSLRRLVVRSNPGAQ